MLLLLVWLHSLFASIVASEQLFPRTLTASGSDHTITTGTSHYSWNSTSSFLNATGQSSSSRSLSFTTQSSSEASTHSSTTASIPSGAPSDRQPTSGTSSPPRLSSSSRSSPFTASPPTTSLTTASTAGKGNSSRISGSRSSHNTFQSATNQSTRAALSTGANRPSSKPPTSASTKDTSIASSPTATKIVNEDSTQGIGNASPHGGPYPTWYASAKVSSSVGNTSISNSLLTSGPTHLLSSKHLLSYSATIAADQSTWKVSASSLLPTHGVSHVLSNTTASLPHPTVGASHLSSHKSALLSNSSTGSGFLPSNKSAFLTHPTGTSSHLLSGHSTRLVNPTGGSGYLPSNKSAFLPHPTEASRHPPSGYPTRLVNPTAGTIHRPGNGSALMPNATRYHPSQRPSMTATKTHKNSSSIWQTWYKEQCMLWDKSCKGDQSEALEDFFNNTGSLFNIVYNAHCIWSLDPQCKDWELPRPQRVELLEWLRSPQCIQSFSKYHSEHPEDTPWTYKVRDFTGFATKSMNFKTMQTTTSGVGCCGQCMLQGGNVDVYYWPSPDVQTTCLPVIGSKLDDVMADIYATDKRGFGYWIDPDDVDVAAASKNPYIPAPIALGGPPDPFYEPNETTIFIKKKSSSIDSADDAYNTRIITPSRPTLSKTASHSPSSQKKPDPAPKSVQPKAAPSTTALHSQADKRVITSAAIQPDGPKEATIGHFTW